MNTCIFILAGARIETYSFDLVTVLQLNNEASFELLRKGDSVVYKRNSQGWRKHLDFILVDEVVLFLCLTLALFIRINTFSYRIQIYRVLCIVYLMINAMVAIIFNTMHNVVKRGYLNEFVHTLMHCFLGFAFAALFLFATQMGIAYSRIALFLAFLFHVVFGYIFRIAWKGIIKKRGLTTSTKDSMLVVLQPNTADEMMRRLTASELEGYKIAGVVLTESTERTEVAGFPIVTTLEETASYVSQRWIDAVYIDCPTTDPRIRKLMQECREMALTTHYHEELCRIMAEHDLQLAKKEAGV